VNKEMELIDFGKVFKVLEEAEYNHEAEKVFEACFKNWKVSLNSVEGMVAGLIRLILFEMVTEFEVRLSNKKYDIRDVLFFMVIKMLGVEKLSQLVEIAERGLEKMYEEKDFSSFSVCVLKMLEWFLERVKSGCGLEEVVVQ
jgi:hypothetical protein